MDTRYTRFVSRWQLRAMSVALVAVLVASASTEVMCAAWCAIERACVQAAESTPSQSPHHHAAKAPDAGEIHHDHGVAPTAGILPTDTHGDEAFVSAECCQPTTGLPIASLVASRSDDLVNGQQSLAPLFLAADRQERSWKYLRTRDADPPSSSRSIQLASVLRI